MRKCIDRLAAYGARRISSRRPTLVVCSLDRLASSIDRLTDIVCELAEKRIAIEIIRDGIGGRSADDLLHVLLLIRTFRKENIADKTQRGVVVADKRGRLTGRPPKLTEKQLESALGLIAKGRAIADVAKEAGVSVPTLYRYRVARERSNRTS